MFPGTGDRHLAQFLPFDEVPIVVVRRLGLVTFLQGASCGAGRLDHVDITGASDDFLSWDPVRLLSVLVYLVLFSHFLPFEEQDVTIPLEAFYLGLGYV